MSNPYEHHPLSPQEPWLAQTAESSHQPQSLTSQPQDAAPVPPQHGLPQQGPPAQSPWQPPRPEAKQNNGLAITALVVAVIALLIGLGGALSGVIGAIVFGGLASFPAGLDAMNGMQGTAPQVVEGQEYSGELLQKEIARVLGGDGGPATLISCPATPSVDPGAVTACHGVVDGSDYSYKVTFQDALGHFTLDEQAD